MRKTRVSTAAAAGIAILLTSACSSPSHQGGRVTLVIGFEVSGAGLNEDVTPSAIARAAGVPACKAVWTSGVGLVPNASYEILLAIPAARRVTVTKAIRRFVHAATISPLPPNAAIVLSRPGTGLPVPSPTSLLPC